MREEGEHRGIVELVVPQRVLGAAGEQRHVRPARIGVHEGGVTQEARRGIVAAQNDPFGQLARDRVRNGVFCGVDVVFLALAGKRNHPLELVDVGGRGGSGWRENKRARDRPNDRVEHRAAVEHQTARGHIGRGKGRHLRVGALGRLWHRDEAVGDQLRAIFRQRSVLRQYGLLWSLSLCRRLSLTRKGRQGRHRHGTREPGQGGRPRGRHRDILNHDVMGVPRMPFLGRSLGMRFRRVGLLGLCFGGAGVRGVRLLGRRGVGGRRIALLGRRNGNLGAQRACRRKG